MSDKVLEQFACTAAFNHSPSCSNPVACVLRRLPALIAGALLLAGNAHAVVPIQFGASNYAGDEGGAITIEVLKPSPDAQDATVDFSVSGLAVEGTDYTVSTASPLSWPGTDTSPKTITITLLDDTVVEPGESLQVTLSNPQSGPNSIDDAALGTITTATVLIRDNDPGPGAGASVVSGDAQSGVVGATLQSLVLAVTDGGSPVENLLVTWSVSPASAATLQTSSSTTGADGTTSNTVTLLQDGIGQVTVTAVAQAVGRLDFTIDTGLGTLPPAVVSLGKVTGDAQIASPGDTLNPFTVQLLDQSGQPIAGNDVNWSLDPPDAGTLVNATTTTGSDGRTSNTLTLDPAASGVVTVTAAAVGAGQVAFTVTTSGFAGLPGLSSNERSTAQALESTCTALQGGSAGLEALAAACNAQGAELITAIQQITPDQVASQGTHSVEMQHNQFVNINARLVQLRAGATGASASGLTLNFDGQPLLTRGVSYLLSHARGGGASADDASPPRLGVFVNGSGSFGDRDSTSDELGFDFNTTGITAGADYRISDTVILGAALGYISNDLDFDNAKGDQEIEGYTLSAFGTWYQSERAYVDAIVSYGWNSFDIDRRIQFGTTDITATGDTDGTELAASVGVGYDFVRDAWSFGPFARVDYIKAEIDAYDEDPAGGLEQGYDDQDVDSLTTLLGGQISYAISTRRGVFSPQLRFEWAHEFENDSRNITARFLNDPNTGNFNVATDNPDKDYFNLGAGVSAAFAQGRSAFLYYEAVLGRDNLTEHSIAGGIRFEF